MINVKETLDQIFELEGKLNVYFGGMISEVIRDMTDQYWTVFSEATAEKNNDGSVQKFTRASDVGWSEESPLENTNDDDDREHVYMEEVKFVVRKEDFTLVCIRTCTGDGCEDLIFDNSKEIKYEDLISY